MKTGMEKPLQTLLGKKKNLLRYLKTKLPALFEVKKGHDVYLKKIVWVILI